MENLRGAAFMVLAMACFAIEDALFKTLSATLPMGQILTITCLGGLCAFTLWFLMKSVRLWQPEYLDPKVLLRSACDVGGSVMFATSLSLIPLTTASAVIQATPLVVAMGAAIFLGQPVGWRRWLAITAGFCGVLIILRPGLEGFNSAVLLSVGGMLGLAARDLLTRALNVSLTGPQLASHTFALIIPASCVLMYAQGQRFVMPNGYEAALLAACTVIAVFAYLTLVAATRHGNAGIISSFRYSRMIFALILGYVVFAETPDLLTILGITIIIASGIFTLLREARLARASLTAAAAI
ncbi:DMT family transporter [Yoonia sediminilitoris]|uniref:EamA-like transporter family protein n=1 Tax=Yoonia sediminilitoris TaxID=1286148 RepID=A0A2T6KRX1_9RHOB|nr:DMT family transporter [Yoonia sediminilitoris]PUB19314.1 EamA-like transporter family protein [Yoonia sediminilitoris]RCW99482.1 EamA-like transporter family protein [Yoonia sediminilitoris]